MFPMNACHDTERHADPIQEIDIKTIEDPLTHATICIIFFTESVVEMELSRM